MYIDYFTVFYFSDQIGSKRSIIQKDVFSLNIKYAILFSFSLFLIFFCHIKSITSKKKEEFHIPEKNPLPIHLHYASITITLHNM